MSRYLAKTCRAKEPWNVSWNAGADAQKCRRGLVCRRGFFYLMSVVQRLRKGDMVAWTGNGGGEKAELVKASVMVMVRVNVNMSVYGRLSVSVSVCFVRECARRQGGGLGRGEL